mmetsp:Transcript_18477/g.27915  ORF Transcript_18477/g.27915 Transcript_18477/m.27915 type:complete len:294 (-) Transcript_18477:97-978(-)
MSFSEANNLNCNLSTDQPSCVSMTTDSLQIAGNSDAQELLLIKKEGENENIMPFQNEKWDCNFQKLIDFVEDHNGEFPTSRSCCDDQLMGWLKRQRCQYMRFLKGQKSTMTKSRIQMLNKIGFVWEQQESLWQQRFSELSEFKLEHGHCYVPHNYSSNPQLPTWVKCQRRQYHLYRKKLPSNMTLERIRKLNKVGFQWAGRRPSGKESTKVKLETDDAILQDASDNIYNELILSKMHPEITISFDAKNGTPNRDICFGKSLLTDLKQMSWSDEAKDAEFHRRIWLEILSDLSD